MEPLGYHPQYPCIKKTKTWTPLEAGEDAKRQKTEAGVERGGSIPTKARYLEVHGWYKWSYK